MARFSGSYGRKRSRIKNLVPIIVVSLIIGAIVYFIFGLDSLKVKDANEVVQNITVETHTGLLPIEQPSPIAVPEPNWSEVFTDLSSQTHPDPNSEVSQLVDRAMKLIEATPTRVIEARDMLNEALPMASPGQQLFIKEQLSALSEEWLFSKKIYPQDSLCSSYKIQTGDLLSTIGSQHKVPWEIIAQINNISDPQSLKADEVIKMINGPFHAKVSRSNFTMDIYLQNTFVKSFSVGLGRPNYETPTGLWIVKKGGKLVTPTWTDPDTAKTYESEDPDYPLGSRWISLEGIQGEAVGRTGFAIHGTKDPDQIGSATSRGCIRLHNGNAILVYNMLMPDFSQVKIVE